MGGHTSNVSALRLSVGLGVAVAAVGLCKYGVGRYPEVLRFVDGAANWPAVWRSEQMQQGGGWALSNFSTAWVAGALHIRGEWSYLIFGVLLAVVAMILPFTFPAITSSPSRAKLLFVMIAGGSFTPILLSWVGGIDAIVVLGAIFAGLSGRWWLTTAGWFVASFSHFSVAVAMLFAVVPLVLCVDRALGMRRQQLLGGATGVLGGFLAISWLTANWGGSRSRLELFREIGMNQLLEAWVQSMPLLLFTTLGVGWVVLLQPQFRSHKATRVFFVTAMVTSVFLPMLVLDESRIAGLALIPALLLWVRSVNPVTTDPGFRTLVVAAIVVPIPLVWEGALLYPGWGETAELISRVVDGLT